VYRPKDARLEFAAVLFFSASLALQAADGKNSKPSGVPSPSEGVQLLIFEVSADKDEGYRSTQTIAGTRTIENLRDTPNSISIINRELMDDLGVTTMGELSAFGVTGEVSTDTEFNRTSYNFRGSAGTQLRNGILWLLPKDTFNLERVEILRGPTAFLYGEGNPGGALNQVTKQALLKNFEKVSLSVGSFDARRVEIDVNRKITDKMAVRLDLAYDDSDSFLNHAHRNFKGLYFAVNYRPYAGTHISANFEYGRNHEIRGSNILADRFSATAVGGATTAYTVTTGGFTLLPAGGQIYNMVGARYSTGTGIAVTDDNVLPRTLNFLGPDSYWKQHYDSVQVTVDQRVSRDFNVQANMIVQNSDRYIRSRAGSLAAGAYLDTNRTRPDGTPNPYFNQYYTESYDRKQFLAEPQRNFRLTAVYDVKLPFTTQRVMAMGAYHASTPSQRYHSEFVDPASPFFSGRLSDANSLAAYQANLAVLQRNFFYRRFYFKDGDADAITQRGVVAGRSVIIRDIVTDGNAGHQARRNWHAPAYGIGASGSYFNGRLRSLVGLRRDSFIQSPTFDYYNSATGETYYVDSTAEVRNRFYKNSANVGGVVHLFSSVSAYFNYAQSVNVSNGVGGVGLVPGTTRGLLIGDGYEYGLRWSFLDSKLESNWTYYVTSTYRNAANPAVPANVKNELAVFFKDLDPNGIDTQTSVASGMELETVANLTKNWRLTWNFSTNDLVTSERFPQLQKFRSRAQQQKSAIPLTESFMLTVPDGTPLPGFTKTTSNLVTNYSFDRGWLKRFSVGGGFQYRDKGYRGNFDLNQDGVAERIWSPSYVLWNLMLGYRTTLLNRKVDFRLNLNNGFDQGYFRSTSLASGSWGAERSFRFATRIDL